MSAITYSWHLLVTRCDCYGSHKEIPMRPRESNYDVSL